MSVLLAVGLVPAAAVSGGPAMILPVAAIVLVPLVALIAGLLSRRREGWRDTRPPTLLVLVTLALFAAGALLAATESASAAFRKALSS